MAPEITAVELKRLLTFSPSTSQSKPRKRRNHSSLGHCKRYKSGDTDVISAHSSSTAESARPETPSVPLDPVSCSDTGTYSALGEAIRNHIIRKNELTLCVSGLPADITTAKIKDLAPDAQTVKIIWDSLSRKCPGSAYLEFGSTKLVHHYLEKLNGLKYCNKIISARTGNLFPEDADRYEWNQLVLYGLHHRTRVAEIARRFPTASSIRIPNSCKHAANRRPIFALVTFPSAQDALSAYNAKLGCVIRKRKIGITWFLKKELQKFPRTCLLVRGLKKSTTERDLQTIFPQAASIVLRLHTGEAILHYDVEEDCLLDKDNSRNLNLFGRPLQVMFCLPTRSKQKDGSNKSNGPAVQSNVAHRKKHAIHDVTQRPTHYKAKRSASHEDPKVSRCIPSTEHTSQCNEMSTTPPSLSLHKLLQSNKTRKVKMNRRKKLKASSRTLTQ